MPFPAVPSIALAKERGRVVEYLTEVQKYMTRLTYNHTGTQFFETRPNSSMITLMDTARSMVREALPIKCMEAVVLSIYLTNGVPCLGRQVVSLVSMERNIPLNDTMFFRFPINFKSELPQARLGGNRDTRRYFYHVVLGMTYGSKFGATGLSRRTTLMDKPLEYSSLFDLIEEFDK